MNLDATSFLGMRPQALRSPALSQTLILAGIVLVAALLRFYRLGDWSFWSDELSSVRGVPDGFNESRLWQSLSLMLVRGAVASLGATEWNARLVPALIGVLSIPLLYFPIRRVVGHQAALLSTLLIAISPWHLYWSQNARFYTALLLFLTLALLAFYFGIEDDRPLYLIFSLILLGLAIKERPIAVIYLPVVLLYLVLLKLLPYEKPPGFRPKTLAFFLLPAAIGGFLFAMPYLRYLPEWIEGFSRVSNSPLWLLMATLYYIRIPVACAACGAAAYLLRRRERGALFLALGALVPFLTVVALSPFLYTATRYIFVALPFWVILASTAVVEIMGQAQRSSRILAVVVLLFVVADSISEDLLYFGYQNGNRENWKGAVELINSRRLDSDRIVTSNPHMVNYYLNEPGVAVNTIDVEQIEQQDGRVWFIEDMTLASTRPEIHSWIGRNTSLIADLDVHAQARTFTMRVYLYTPRHFPRMDALPEDSAIPIPRAGQ